MESRIAKELKLRYLPVAVIFTDEKPEGALQFQEGRWGCVVSMLAAASKGKTACFDRKTFGCGGGQVGLCFGDAYAEFPGGIEYFLSTGRGEGHREGEAYKKTPELAKAFIDQLPITDIPYKYVVFKPLEQVDPDEEKPELVVFFATPDQLSALVVLANFGRAANSVTMPFSAGCHSICLIPYHESLQAEPKAVVGMTDISARPYVDPNTLSFTVPYSMFVEMEENIPGSFLEKESWHKVRERIPNP
ncbi:MAG: DUF169 domain-containing protein [Armatimonadota bacterium]|nr:DUF169 domain-containing protein [Armatimonadota bacterium]